MEQPYAFRARLDAVHRHGRRDPDARPAPDEIEIGPGWSILCPSDAAPALRHAAADFRDYLAESHDVAVALASGAPGAGGTVAFSVDPSVGVSGAYRIAVDAGRVAVVGADPRGAFRGAVELEDRMNLREVPFLARGVTTRAPLVTPRMVHSGRGLEDYPDAHLNAVAHAGFDAVVVFTKGPDEADSGAYDFADLIRRAARHGLGVMFYSKIPGYKHPDDDDAPAFFADAYTRLFERHPGALGVMLVGESAEFPSRDPATTGKRWRESVVDGVPDPRPAPGWWPCVDYPAWIARVRDAVRAAKPDALIVFNTYNWGWASEDVRRNFIDRLPEGVTLQATFEMFKVVRREGLACRVMDYTASVDEPGAYFAGEMAYAHARGVSTLATANTAGLTWDFGCAPYIPTPQQWIRRFRALDRAREDWGVTRYYDNHHYGWWPSVVTDLARAHFQSGAPDPERHLEALARRDFGADAAPAMLAAWDRLSEAIRHFTPTNEDQYGPFRVGPAYPLIFHPNLTRTMAPKRIDFPAAPFAYFGGAIVETFYQPFENAQQAPGSLRFPVELRSLERMRAAWADGVARMEAALAAMPERKRANGVAEWRLARFLLAFIRTGIHVKTWWLENVRLLAASDATAMRESLDRLEALARAEIENARETLPIVDADSRLGWEPSMEYVADRAHLEWKIRQVETMLRGELGPFRELLDL